MPLNARLWCFVFECREKSWRKFVCVIASLDNKVFGIFVLVPPYVSHENNNRIGES